MTILDENIDQKNGDEIEFLRKRIRLLEAVVDTFPGGLLLFDGENRLVLCNHQQHRLLEYPKELFASGNPTLEDIFYFNANRGEYGEGNVDDIVKARMDLVAKRCAHVVERTRPNGTVLEIRGAPLVEGGFVTTYLDVTKQRENQNLINHMAHHDSLTGLANRALMLDRLKFALAGVKRGRSIALHYLDLDKFKPINDKHGHDIGDYVLKKAAAALLHSVRETDTVARIGGDEFVIIQADVESVNGAKLLADRVIKNISETHFLEDLDLSINVSIGVAFAPWDSENPDELLRKADMAMYKSKKAGPGQVSFFSQPPGFPVDEPKDKKPISFLMNQNTFGDAAS
jgi:diguanylate cyclase (GGDEF)-like protein